MFSKKKKWLKSFDYVLIGKKERECFGRAKLPQARIPRTRTQEYPENLSITLLPVQWTLLPASMRILYPDYRMQVGKSMPVGKNGVFRPSTVPQGALETWQALALPAFLSIFCISYN